MIVIPAVDIKDGRCVRLKKGRMSEETVYSDDPVQMAGTWYSKELKEFTWLILTVLWEENGSTEK